MKSAEPVPWLWLIGKARAAALHQTMMGNHEGAAGELAFILYCERRMIGERLKPGEPSIPGVAERKP